jgi:hypothetical protein
MADIQYQYHRLLLPPTATAYRAALSLFTLSSSKGRRQLLTQ